MHIITVKTLSQAANVRDFLQGRAEMEFNKDFTVRLGSAINVPKDLPHTAQVVWKYLDDCEFDD